MMRSATVATEGAEIAYDVEGTGPVLLMIAGAGGDAPRYGPLAARLSDTYTIVRYDRRANSRSTGDPQQELDVAQQARDAVAILDAVGAGQAYVFGNSGGASIALRLTQDRPDRVAGLIIHEAPVITILPDATEWRAFVDEVEGIFRTQGLGPAMMRFAGSLRGFQHRLADPEKRVGEGAGGANMEHFMAREYRPITLFEPDLARIRASGVPVAALVGRASEDAYYVRSTQLVAEALRCPCYPISGHHVAFATDTALFANEFRPILDQLAQQSTANKEKYA